MPDRISPPIVLKALLKRGLARFGFYLGRYPNTDTFDAHLLRLLNHLRINCVLDVGAHEGEFGLWLRRIGYTGRIVSFEPVSAHYARLERARASDPHWLTHHCALGAEDASADINVMAGSTFSSFLSTSDAGAQRFPDKMTVQRTETVPVRRLESLFNDCTAGLPEPRVFLKMDTQGYDLNVVEGAGRALDHVLALQTELAAKPIYRDMRTTLPGALPQLQQAGFEPTGFYPVAWDDDDKVRVVEFDCVMCRTRTSLPTHRDTTAA